MLFFFGTKNKVLGQTQINGTCQACNTGPLMIVGVQKYFHIFYIPMFPISKTGAIECSHCKKTTFIKELPKTERAGMKSQLKSFRTPKYTFTGLILLALFIGWGKYLSDTEAAEAVTRSQSPVQNDIAVILNSEQLYQVLKIVAVAGDTLEIRVGTFGYKSVYEARKAIRKNTLENSDYFEAGTFFIPRSKYQEITQYIQRDAT